MGKKARKKLKQQAMDSNAATLPTDLKNYYLDRYKDAAQRNYPYTQAEDFQAAKENLRKSQQYFNQLSFFAQPQQLDIVALAWPDTKLAMANYQIVNKYIMSLQQSTSLKQQEKNQRLSVAQGKLTRAKDFLAQAYLGQAKKCLANNDYKLALVFYNQIKQILIGQEKQPMYLEVCYKMLEIYRLLNKNFAGVELCNEMLKHRANDAKVHYHLVIAYVSQYAENPTVHLLEQSLAAFKAANKYLEYLDAREQQQLVAIKEILTAKLIVPASELSLGHVLI